MLNKADTSVALKTNDINQTLPAITFGQTTLIPVVHSESAQGLSENFISHLRDSVSAQDGLKRLRITRYSQLLFRYTH
ncbi:hypothetical protein ACOBV9_22450 (plasmid) [Pseudoalteromonas espejiana]